MPLDKNKVLRYQIIDKCLRDTAHRYKMTDLHEYCNKALLRNDLKPCALRTIQDDIKKLRGEPYSIVLDPVAEKEGYYTYYDRSQSFNLTSLSDEEKSALQKTIDLLEPVCKYSHNSQHLWMYHCLRQLQMGNALDLCDSNISFGGNEDFKGMEFFSQVMEAVSMRKPLIVEYHPYFEDSVAFHLHPYHLRQYNNRWFLFGKSEEREGLTNLALDRILSIKTWKNTFIPTDIDFTDYFYDVVGVSVNDEMQPHRILLKVSNRQFPYIDTKPFHGSYREIKEMQGDDYHIVEFNMAINYELTSQLLSYGAEIEVLEPTCLRETMANLARMLHSNYQPMPGKIDE